MAIAIITDEQLESAACIFVEKGSMTNEQKHQFLSSLAKRAKALGVKKPVVIAEYQAGTTPPVVLSETEWKVHLN
jgi:polyhydroxyalkanoate synthesis regulator phasin